MIDQVVPPDSVQRPRRVYRRVTTKALPQDSRANNRALVLQMLFQADTMSRADIARATGLTRATVSTLVGDLVREGMLAERGVTAATRVGKPGILVGLQEDAFHIVALDLSGSERFTAAEVNLRGAIFSRAHEDVEGATGEQAFEVVVRLAENVARNAGRPLLGIGIGSPGIVAPAGIVLEAPHLGWADFPLADRLAQRIGLPVHVGNDANAAALGVRTFREPSRQDLIVLNLAQGAGAGLIIGGSLLEGEQFAAGEIGHVTIDDDGELCVCGRRGCLELTIAVPNILRRLAAAGEGEGTAVLADAGRALGKALAPVISALNLHRVVLRGPADVIGGPLLDSARRTICERTISAVSAGLDIGLVEGGEDLVLLGAAVLVLSALVGVS